MRKSNAKNRPEIVEDIQNSYLKLHMKRHGRNTVTMVQALFGSSSRLSGFNLPRPKDKPSIYKKNVC